MHSRGSEVQATVMEVRSVEEQEKDVRELVRRADRTAVRTSPQRREALKRLIELAHSPHAKLKIFAAQSLKGFIKDFPDLEDDAINAVYDLCEDQVSKVRITGYFAIVDVSKEQLKWVKRNADVLVQLLQSDEPDEVQVVKRALSQHLDMDPAVTLGVLCDQIVPSDEPMDEEEQAIRNRLRSLVLSFITGEAKRAIVERHTNTPGSASEETLVSGLFKAIGKVAPADVDIIVKDILLSLASFKPFSTRGQQLLDVILARARQHLDADLSFATDKVQLKKSRYWLDLASFVAVGKRVAHPIQLLQFYVTSLVMKETLQKLVPEAQIFVLSSIAAVISAVEKDSSVPSSGADEDALRRSISEHCVTLLQVFAELPQSQENPWNACHALLQACGRYKKAHNWEVPPHLVPVLETLQTLVATTEGARPENEEDIQSLIRSLLPSTGQPTEPAATTDNSKGTNSTPSASNPPKSERRIMNVKRKHEERLQPSARPQTSASAGSANGRPASPARGDRQRTAASPMPGQQRSTTATTKAQDSRANVSEDQPRAAKRAKKGAGAEETRDIPSLLSRLGTVPPSRSVSERTAEPASKRRVESAPVSFSPSRGQDPDKDPVGGYSIKGAAKAGGRNHSSTDGRNAKSSLLDRMQGFGGSEGGGHNRRKNRTRS